MEELLGSREPELRTMNSKQWGERTRLRMTTVKSTTLPWHGKNQPLGNSSGGTCDIPETFSSHGQELVIATKTTIESIE